MLAQGVVLWLVTGFYVVNPGQVGVNMLFGSFVSQTTPGLRWNWPVPIGDHYTPDVATRYRVEVGFRAETASGSDRDVPEESLMLTGNENIIDVRAVVLWRINNVEQFLFGTERRSLLGIRAGLADIQKGRCFYCGSPLRGGEVDHFIPWSRYPRDLAHNFVLADAKCNSLKSDLLAAPRHTRNWIERNALHEKLVAEVGVSAGFIADLTESLRIAEWSYSQAATAGASARAGSAVLP